MNKFYHKSIYYQQIFCDIATAMLIYETSSLCYSYTWSIYTVKSIRLIEGPPLTAYQLALRLLRPILEYETVYDKHLQLYVSLDSLLPFWLQ